jgi:uncharacterized protein YbjT (DUF2867 family)
MIAVTAPTSRIGHQVVRAVLDSGEPVRVVARDPARLSDEVRDRAEVVEGSHRDAEVVDRAFAGADAVFWLVPADPRAATVDAAYLDFSRPAVEAFSRGGVGRVVGVSALGRGTPVAGRAGHVTASLAMDDVIAATGVPYRALALPSFMDNVARQTASIMKDGVFTGVIAGDLKAPTCSTGDIATVAARLLLDGTWTGTGEVPVLGPEDLSFDDQAAIMTEVLGRPVRYQQVPGAAFKARMIGFGLSDAMAQALLDMAIAKNDGLDNGAPRTPESSSPTTFREWCTQVLKPAALDV